MTPYELLEKISEGYEQCGPHSENADGTVDDDRMTIMHTLKKDGDGYQVKDIYCIVGQESTHQLVLALGKLYVEAAGPPEGMVLCLDMWGFPESVQKEIYQRHTGDPQEMLPQPSEHPDRISVARTFVVTKDELLVGTRARDDTELEVWVAEEGKVGGFLIGALKIIVQGASIEEAEKFKTPSWDKKEN